MWGSPHVICGSTINISETAVRLAMLGPDFEKYSFFGPSPKMPCLANLNRALASQECSSCRDHVIAEACSAVIPGNYVVLAIIDSLNF